ncbi:hypothetical protein [Metabacillus fastidiosus]|uniref:hypothetical protein n=1 Tax=Metabacillus fastidiosus TaxID=1458 RepID=UPI003D2A47DA
MALIPRGYRVYCNKGLAKKIVIANDTLEFRVDGIDYIITLQSGVYETLHEPFMSELPDMINQGLQANSVPVRCKLGGVYDYADNRTVLVFEHIDVNIHHDLEIMGGTAYPFLVGSVLNTDEHEDGVFDFHYDHKGTMLVVYSDFAQLSTDLNVRCKVWDDRFTGSVAVRREGERSLSGSMRVVSASRLDGSLIVRKSHSEDIKGFIAIPTDGQHDLGSFLIVRILK